MTIIPTRNPRTGMWLHYDIPDEVLEAANLVSDWIRSQHKPETIRIYGLAITEHLDED